MRRTAVLVALVGALMAACSGELSPSATVARTATETSDAGSARVSYEATFELAAAPRPLEMSGHGAFDYAHHRGRMLFDMSDVLQQSGNALEGAGEVEMIFDGSVLYMKVPFLTRSLPDPRPWIKIDVERAAEQGRADLAQFSQLGQGDPTQMLELLGGLTKDVEDVGSQDVRGADTTHYRMVLDLSKALDGASAQARSSVQGLMARSGTRRLPADIWIDGDGRMRKMTYDVALTSTAAATETGATPGTRDEMRVTMELYEFGIVVDVDPPPPDEVVDLLQLTGQGGSS